MSRGEQPIDRKTSVYFTLTDRDLTVDRIFQEHVTLEKLVLLLNLHALFFDHVVIPDGASLYNPVLRQLLLDPKEHWRGVGRLIGSGTLAWSQRDVTSSFRDLHEFMTGTGSWRTDDSDELHRLLDLLDDLDPVRLPYDYKRTGRLFTDLTEAACAAPDVIIPLGVEHAAADAYLYSERLRRTKSDGFARRTAVYEFAARLDRRGATRKARMLRQLSSTLYHGSAATDMHLPIAYPSQYREALNALYRTDVPALARTAAVYPAVRPSSTLHTVPFYVQALQLVDADFIHDLHNAKQFKKYARALRRVNEASTSEAADRFSKELAEYVDFLNVPLSELFVGRYRVWKRWHRAARVVKYTGRAGTITTAFAGAVSPELALPMTGVSVVWGFGGWQLTEWLTRRIRSEEAQSQAVGAMAMPVKAVSMTEATSG